MSLYACYQLIVASLGHGIPYGKEHSDPDFDPANSRANLHRIIFDYLAGLAPQPKEVVIGASGKKEGKNGYINGSKAGTGKSWSGRS